MPLAVGVRLTTCDSVTSQEANVRIGRLAPAPTCEGDRRQTIEYVRGCTERPPIEHLVVEFAAATAGDLRNASHWLAEELRPALDRDARNH